MRLEACLALAFWICAARSDVESEIRTHHLTPPLAFRTISHQIFSRGSAGIVRGLARRGSAVAGCIQLSRVLTECCFGRSEHSYVARRLVCLRFHLDRMVFHSGRRAMLRLSDITPPLPSTCHFLLFLCGLGLSQPSDSDNICSVCLVTISAV